MNGKYMRISEGTCSPLHYSHLRCKKTYWLHPSENKVPRNPMAYRILISLNSHNLGYTGILGPLPFLDKNACKHLSISLNDPITHPRLSVSVKSVPWRTLAMLAGVTGEGRLRATNGFTVLFGYGIETLTAHTFENAESAEIS